MLLLALLLAAGQPGCYVETNDDVAIILLLRGTTAGAPVTDLPRTFMG